MSNLIYIMGKSASGKDTVYKQVKERIDSNSYVLYTTRPMREGEKEGREYNFITREQFEKLEKDQKVIEARHYNVVNAQGQKDVWTYATIDDKQWEKEGNFLTIGTLESYNSISKYLSEHPEKDLKLLPIYIEIDEAERRKRAIERENKSGKPNFEEMERRLKADNIDFSEEKIIEAGITKTFKNYDLNECVDNIVRYIEENTMKNNRSVVLRQGDNGKMPDDDDER